MSAYGILGATGNTGLCILKLLNKKAATDPGAAPDVHILIRSRSKLERLYPDALTNPKIKIFEGNISNQLVLKQCLQGTRAVFLAVAITDNKPGSTITMDTSKAVVEALESLKAQQTAFKPPKLIQLSAAPADPKFLDKEPWFVRNVVTLATSNIYKDLEIAERYLRSYEDWLTSIFVMPGGLSFDEQYGHELSLTHSQDGCISFLDLAAAMIEAADDENGKWDMQNVSVLLKGGQKIKFASYMPFALAMGLIVHFFPFLYPYLPGGY
ncbi:hypothetical protein BU23DRAFT_602437 [Bimuria novae-zelandiae CBS 107.79]|uniref:NAD(P)-binding domain-containing protein n=1 Tax=Bimuria novae-zelandiae CBS 107.79 TaxID=1447943 RepID=A0A6A5UTW5_9PLEO|nr:hypothetical protein BU23DRAFT_602437 [Bimuria novae-zelandiae CBS 107.79]